MRIAIIGAGGVGGLFATLLVRAGERVALIARGAHLEAIRRDGLHLATPEGELVAQPELVTDDPADVGAVDAVLVAVKTWQLPATAPTLSPLIGPQTVVLPLQNGVEAAGELTAVLGAGPVIGGSCGTVTYLTGPGRLETLARTHWIKLGELDGRASERVARLRDVLAAAGIATEVAADIHAALWDKLLFVASLGGVGALARQPVGVLRAVPESRALLVRAMEEIAQLAHARGIALPDDAALRALARIDKLPAETTASLQRDLAAGRRSELDAWSGAIVRLGRESGVATPVHETIYAALLPSELAAPRRRHLTNAAAAPRDPPADPAANPR